MEPISEKQIEIKIFDYPMPVTEYIFPIEGGQQQRDYRLDLGGKIYTCRIALSECLLDEPDNFVEDYIQGEVTRRFERRITAEELAPKPAPAKKYRSINEPWLPSNETCI